MLQDKRKKKINEVHLEMSNFRSFFWKRLAQGRAEWPTLKAFPLFALLCNQLAMVRQSWLPVVSGGEDG